MADPIITPELVETAARALHTEIGAGDWDDPSDDLSGSSYMTRFYYQEAAKEVLAAVVPLIDRAARADELHKLAHDVLKGPEPSATPEKSAAVKQFADAVTFRAESFEPPAPRHNPCCSSHGVPMSCAYYRHTHFVEVRPCCEDDARRLSAPVEEN